MSDTVGRIDLILDVDGKGLSGKVRRAGEKAGKEAGEGFNDKFGDELTDGAKERNKKIGDEGRKAGESYSDARDRLLNKRNRAMSDRLAKAFETPKGLSDYLNKFDSADEGIKNLRSELKELHKQNLITDEDFKRNSKTLTDNRRTILRAEAASIRAAEAQRNFNDSWDEAIRHNKAFDRQMKESARKFNEDWATAIRVNREFDKSLRDRNKETERATREAERHRKELERLRVSTLNVFRDGDDGFRRYVQRFPTAREGVENLRDSLRRLHKEHIITTEDAVRHRRALTDFITSVERGPSRMDRFREGLRGMTQGMNLFGRSANQNTRQMPYFLKTIVGYTALFTALAPGIAVLSSTVGSGALALSVGAGALALAAVTLIPAFKGMLGDIDKLPPKARGAAKALQRMGGPLHDLQDTIQEGVFEGLGPQIDKLSDRIFPRLERGFGKTAKTLNGVFRDLIDGLTSKDSLGRIDRVFDGLQPVLRDVSGAVLNLLGSFSKLFEAALPAGQGFAKFLNQTLGDFNNWLTQDEGRDALRTFFDHLDTIMPRVGNLIGAAGKAVSSLVTEEAVNNMAKFLDTMTVAVPEVVAGLGGLVDSLDPLGLAADAVAKIGDYFSAHTKDLKDFGGAAQDFVRSGAAALGPAIEKIADAILKVAPDILRNLADVLKDPGVQGSIADVGEALATTATSIGDLVKALSDSGTIALAFKAIGGAAQIAAGFVQTLDSAILIFTGDWEKATKKLNGIGKVDLPFLDFLTTPDKDAKKNYKAGGVKGALQGLQDGLAGLFDPTSDKRLTRELEKQNKASKEKGREGGEKIANSYSDGVREGLEKGAKSKNSGKAATSMALLALDGLFDIKGDGGKEKAKSKGKEAGTKLGGSYKEGAAEGVKNGGTVKATAGVTGIVDSILNLFGGGDAEAKAKAKGAGVGGGYAGGVAGGLAGAAGLIDGAAGGAAEKVSTPFQGVPGKIGTFIAGLPDLVNGIVGQSNGQPGADSTANPFNSVKDRINAGIAGVPTSVTSKVGESSGQPGANRTADPFGEVAGKVAGHVSGVPGSVTAKVGEASGQRGADNTSSPFAKVAGYISGHVNGIPGIVTTALSLVSGQSAADRIVSAFQGVKDRVASALSGLSSIVNGILSGAQAGAAAAASTAAAAARNIPKTAVGGTFAGSQLRIIGEAGPEAVVPLNRPLSQVDPSVRMLSAIAQGKYPAAAATGGGGKQVTVAQGAIMVQAPNADAEQVASAMLDRLVANL